MKEALVSKGLKVEIIDSPIPVPKAGQLLIQVFACGFNPKDWKAPEWFDIPPTNQGDDIAGIVHSMGQGVSKFQPGDRVAAFHEMLAPHGGWAEYAVVWEHTTFHLPEEMSFDGQSQSVSKFLEIHIV
jgi:NADPH:quinone reductase